MTDDKLLFPDWKIIQIVATRCHINWLKCTKFVFGWGFAPDPAGRAYSVSPDPRAGFKGPTVRGREERKGVKGGEEKDESKGKRWGAERGRKESETP